MKYPSTVLDLQILKSIDGDEYQRLKWWMCFGNFEMQLSIEHI